MYKVASNWKSGSDDGDFQKGRKIMHALLGQAIVPGAVTRIFTMTILCCRLFEWQDGEE